MKPSARDQSEGRTVAVRTGRTTNHVRMDAGNGVAITDEAVGDPGSRGGDEATTVIGASDPMVAE